jgi:crotonobetainyl-CoA:carnitine CoA-transferase CaiB-like acyl-CoA transferase
MIGRNDEMSGALAGIRVVELGQMIAVPAATYLLAGYGASVIKVEDTGAGDGLRYFGSAKNGMSGWFATTNGGKRAIALDLKSEDGRAVLWRLIERADVFIEGFRAGVIDRLGFGYDAVRERAPQLVYCSSSGFGATGPYADQPVFDPLIQSLAGWAGIQQQDGTPTLVRGMVADKVGAYTNAQAIMAALVQRSRTGTGAQVQVNMLEANLAFNWPDVMMDCTLLDADADHRPNILAAYRLYRCSDGWVGIAPGVDRHWQGMCEALERPDAYADERFKTSAGRGAHLPIWFELIGAMVARFSVADVVTRLRTAEVPVAPVLMPHEVHTDPHVQATGMLEEVEHPLAGRLRRPRPAGAFLGSPPELSPAPQQGEHTVPILRELGFGADDIERLLTQAAVKTSATGPAG